MANSEHIAKLKNGVEEWNRWRNSPVIPIHYPDLSWADLDQACLSGVDLRRANLSGANLRQANLAGADLRQADFSEADLSRARLSKSDFSEANLMRASLPGANLRQANLAGADLRQADLSEADLSGARLSKADFSGANLSGADLIGADLLGANLSLADLRVAKLNGTNLSVAQIRGAKLSGAHFHGTILGATCLRDAQGLDTCNHLGPSILDHLTLTLSGRLPDVFLRGCGLPDKLIDYLPALLEEAIQFYSCFISYSTKDQDFADRLYSDLQNKGVRCWFAPHHVEGGKKLHEQIDAAIRVYDRLLLVLSEHSMNSEWVRTEIAKARKRELREGRRMLFPVRLVNFETLRGWECFDADTGKDSAREIREYFIPDFSQWTSHGPYQQALARLLRDLKAEVEQ
jgi:uncharacterized protein YjbI with pentapeptide repeats